MTRTTTTVTEIRKEQRDTALTEALAYLWERSVRASHNFLKECDIANLKPYVKEALQAVGTLLVARSGQECAAFCGIQDSKIEMLFASPEFFGKGIGRQLVGIAIKEHGATLVDVNEQNPKAAGFLQAHGLRGIQARRDRRPRKPLPHTKNETEMSGAKACR